MHFRNLAVAGALVLGLTGSAQAFDWSGFYAGIVAGKGDGLIMPAGFSDEPAPGLVGGAQIGYNIQQGVVVIGIQSELLASTMTWNGDDPPDTIDWLGSTTAVLGVGIDRLLPYLKAGVAYASGTGSYSSVSASALAVGWTAGGGVEVALTDNVSVFGEYSVYSLGPTTLDFTPYGTIDATISATLIKGGVNVGF